MPAALYVLAGWLGQKFGVQLAKFIAYKALFIFLLVTVLPIVLTNLIVKLLSTVVSYITTDLAVSGTLTSSLTLSLTGMTAYVASALCLPEALAIVLTAVAVRFTLELFTFRNLLLTKYTIG
jgi:hypothetical protein